jgi:hypothetical protein
MIRIGESIVSVSEPRESSFCCAQAAVLDCANGHEKENQEEVNAIEEKRNQEGVLEEASTKDGGEEENRFEQGRRPEVDHGPNKESEVNWEKVSQRKSRTEIIGTCTSVLATAVRRSAGSIECRECRLGKR